MTLQPSSTVLIQSIVILIQNTVILIQSTVIPPALHLQIYVRSSQMQYSLAAAAGVLWAHPGARPALRVLVAGAVWTLSAAPAGWQLAAVWGGKAGRTWRRWLLPWCHLEVFVVAALISSTQVHPSL
jgi:hypothetical protein